MSGDYGFRVPVSGQKIPHGWFAALVRFMNSLILRGDGRFTMVSRDESGTSVTLTPAVVSALTRAAGGTPPGSGGGSQELSVTVSGNTATIGLSGSTATAQLVGTGDVSIYGNTNGQIEIDAAGGGGGGGGFGFPDYSNEIVAPGDVDLSGTTTYSYPYPVWLMGSIGMTVNDVGEVWADISLWIGSSPNQRRFEILEINATAEDNARIEALSVPMYTPIPANVPFYFLMSATDSDLVRNELAIYGCAGAAPLADYTVTRASGTTNGTLFYGLSQQGDNTVSVDSSLDGTPLDFEGASVL